MKPTDQQHKDPADMPGTTPGRLITKPGYAQDPTPQDCKLEFVTLIQCPRCKKEEQELLTDGVYIIFGECRNCGYNREESNDTLEKARQESGIFKAMTQEHPETPGIYEPFKLCQCKHGLMEHNRFMGENKPFGCVKCDCEVYNPPAKLVRYVYISHTHDAIDDITGYEIEDGQDINDIYNDIEENSHTFESGILLSLADFERLKTMTPDKFERVKPFQPGEDSE
jgi:Zn ribbon nucleic-acid-binding protein